MKVSIILPSLNVVNYIEECLESVVSQTLDDMEIICVDAGSTDGTMEIIERFSAKDSRIRIIHSDRKSYGYQMNLGIRAAVGEYIGIVETDDLVMPDMFKTLYNEAKKSRVDFIKSGYIEFFEQNNQKIKKTIYNQQIKKVEGQILSLSEQPEYRTVDINHIWSAIYCREFLLSNGLWFNETLGASFQDTSFSILVGLVAETCIYTSEAFYLYRTDRSESSVKSDSKITCVRDEFSYVDNYLAERGMNTPVYQKYIRSLKLGIYRWNMMRLSADSREIFRKETAEEIKAISVQYGEELSGNDKENIRLLLNPKEICELEKLQETKRQLFVETIRDAEQKGAYVVVSAGIFFQRILEIQRWISFPLVEAVCDNNSLLYGSQIENYKVLSVEEASTLYKTKQWLIANKKYGNEIREQLVRLGVGDDHIKWIDMIPELNTIYNELVK